LAPERRSWRHRVEQPREAQRERSALGDALAEHIVSSLDNLSTATDAAE